MTSFMCCTDFQGSDSPVVFRCFLLNSKSICGSHIAIQLVAFAGNLISRYIHNVAFIFINSSGVIKFFGFLSQSRPEEVTQQYPAFLQKVFSFLTSHDPALKLMAIQTVGAVAHSEPGLRVLFADKAHSEEVMKILGSNIKSFQGEYMTRSLEALASIFYSADLPSDDLSEVTRSLYTPLATGAQPLQLLLEISKQPFQEVHQAVLTVFKSLAKYKWAQEEMIACPGIKKIK